MTNYKRSPIFYMGNKYKLLKQLIPLFPNECENFYDLFGGSGVVSMNYQGKNKTIYNESNYNIVELIRMVVDNDPKELDEYWQTKINEYGLTKTISVKNAIIDTTKQIRYNKINYDKLRDDYNKDKIRDYKNLYLLSVYSINHLIRFNGNNEFNASYGTNQEYTRKNYKQICDMHESFKNVNIINGNAFDLNLENLGKEDFIYCDPPYLNTEAVYNEKRAFGKWDINDDYRLFKMLEIINRKGVKFGMSNVFENRGVKNEHLIKWCNDNKWYVHHLSKNYNPFSRANSNSDEVYICNYKF